MYKLTITPLNDDQLNQVLDTLMEFIKDDDIQFAIGHA